MPRKRNPEAARIEKDYKRKINDQIRSASGGTRTRAEAVAANFRGTARKGEEVNAANQAKNEKRKGSVIGKIKDVITGGRPERTYYDYSEDEHRSNPKSSVTTGPGSGSQSSSGQRRAEDGRVGKESTSSWGANYNKKAAALKAKKKKAAAKRKGSGKLAKSRKKTRKAPTYRG